MTVTAFLGLKLTPMCCFNFNFVIKLWEGLYVNFSIVSANHLVRSETPLWLFHLYGHMCFDAREGPSKVLRGRRMWMSHPCVFFNRPLFWNVVLLLNWSIQPTFANPPHCSVWRTFSMPQWHPFDGFEGRRPVPILARLHNSLGPMPLLFPNRNKRGNGTFYEKNQHQHGTIQWTFVGSCR